MSLPLKEPTTVGLSEKTKVVLERLKDDGHFSDMADAYRFGIALALAHGVIPDDPPSPRGTIYSVATVDPEREFSTAIRALMDTNEVPVYRWVERLAEWGVTELGRRAENGEIDFGGILEEAGRANRT